MAPFANFLYLLPNTTECQKISNMQLYAVDFINLSDTEIFIFSYGTYPSYPNQFLKITFNSTYADWMNKMICSTSSWGVSSTNLAINSDKTVIYSFFIYGSNPSYLHFISLSASDGKLLSKIYRSTIQMSHLVETKVSGEFVISIIYPVENNV